MERIRLTRKAPPAPSLWVSKHATRRARERFPFFEPLETDVLKRILIRLAAQAEVFAPGERPGFELRRLLYVDTLIVFVVGGGGVVTVRPGKHRELRLPLD